MYALLHMVRNMSICIQVYQLGPSQKEKIYIKLMKHHYNASSDLSQV